MSSNAHVPVLLEAVLDGLDIKENGVYVDATFGRGGHSSAILDKLGVNGRLIAIDRDPQAITAAPAGLVDDPRFQLIRGEIAALETLVREQGSVASIDGLLLDLGVSSPQLDEAARGFSFLRDGPLDMRMDPESGKPAAEILRTVDEKTLKSILRKYGEEPQAARIARAIVTARNTAPIESTAQLAALVDAAVPARKRRKHPATRTFQALRIFVNAELEQLQQALAKSLDLLATDGRLCVISFHSLEDRLVKRFVRDNSLVPAPYRGLPTVPAEYRPKLRPVGKAIAASDAEISANPRARSARLRIAARL